LVRKGGHNRQFMATKTEYYIYQLALLSGETSATAAAATNSSNRIVWLVSTEVLNLTGKLQHKQFERRVYNG